MPRPVYSDAQITVTVDDEARLVRYVRSHEPYPSLEVLRQVNERLHHAVDALPTGELCLLVDTRDAPPRNDEAFEVEINRVLGAIMPRFSAHAVLVKTAVGRLHAGRVAKARGAEGTVFTDEAAALEFLRSKRA